MQGHKGIKIIKRMNSSGTLSKYNIAGKSSTAKAAMMIDWVFHPLIHHYSRAGGSPAFFCWHDPDAERCA
jgi:hypothetical protein